MVDDLKNSLDDAINGVGSTISSLDKTINSLKANGQTTRDFQSEGFNVPPSPFGDGNGLPSQKVPPERLASTQDGGGAGKRRLIHWFIPEFGVVRMYVNPNSITYQHKKVIKQEKTKGGYMLQYWGEGLSTLSIRGTTGSSGVEGINVLYEMYRAEQYAFDPVGLSLAAANSNNGLSNSIMNGVNGLVSNSEGTAGQVLGGIGAGALGAALGSSNGSALATRNIPSLASLAFGVEMYYQGWVFRGYFENMNITESADNFLWQYDMNFIVTQRRGYRTNYMPFHRSATSGPSNNSEVGGVPLSFKGLKR